MTQLDLAPLAPVDSAPLSAPVDTGRRTLTRRAAPVELLSLSVSEVHTLNRCKREYKFGYEAGREPAAPPSLEMRWGSNTHRGLEGWFLALQGASPRAVDEMLAAVDAHGTDDHGHPYGPPADPLERAALRAVLRAYAAYWGESDAAMFEIVAVELPFRMPILTARGKPMASGALRDGRIDLLVRERATGDTFVTEHKTTGKEAGNDRFYLGLALDLQIVTYFDVARELGHDPAGAIYDVLTRPPFDRPLKKAEPKKDGTPRKVSDEDSKSGKPKHEEPAAEYEERLFGIIAADVAEGNAARWFARAKLTFDAAQIAEGRMQFHDAAADVLTRRRTKRWPIVGDRYVCAKFNEPCPWLRACLREVPATDEKVYPLKRKNQQAMTEGYQER